VFLWLILWPEFGAPRRRMGVPRPGPERCERLPRRQAGRRWNQISSLGRILDPAADRLFVLSTLVGLTWRGILPLWLTLVLLVARG